MPLTDTWLKKNLGKARAEQHIEPDRDGLSVRVSPKGKITFQMRFRYEGKQARLDLGSYPNLTLLQARQELQKMKGVLEAGHDPRVHKKLEVHKLTNALTFKELYLEWHDKVFELFNKLKSNGIFLWSEVEQFATAFFSRNKSNAVLANICKPAIERWQQRYNKAIVAYSKTKDMLERCKQTGDAVLIGNAEKDFAEAKKAKDELEIFKKDLGTFTRFYEFMSQIVDYDDKELEKLSLFARNLRPMLRENIILDDEIDLSNIEMSHYRLSKLRQIDIELQANSTEHQLEPSNDVGSATAKDKKEDFLSSIIHRLNEVFVTDKLTDQDMINYANTIADKVYENNGVMSQIANNTREQAMLGDFPKAMDDAILGSSAAHQEQMMQLLSDPAKAGVFARVIFDMLSMR